MFEYEIQRLTEKFLIVGEPLYLSTFFTVGGKKEIFKQLQMYRKDVFDNNERIIIIQDCIDEYRFRDHPGQALTFIQESLQLIDISNFFVLVVTGNSNIKEELEWLQQHCSTDHNPIQSQLIDAPYEKITQTRDTFCMLPWIHLYSQSDGALNPCCTADYTIDMGNIKDPEFFNNKQATNLRYEMLNGYIPKVCNRCFRDEDKNQVSRRQRENNRWGKYKEEVVSKTNDNGSLNEFTPRFLDIRYNNLCNLKCRTCSGMSSSRIAVEEDELFGNSYHKNLPKVKQFEIVEQYFNNVDEVYFAGGEPLLMDEHYKTLDALIAVGKTDIQLRYNTNFSILQYKDKNLIDYWNQFKRVQLGISIDGVGDQLEYCRNGVSWHKVESNLEALNECPHVLVKVTSVVSILSILSLIELQHKWISENKIEPENFIMNVTLSSTEYLFDTSYNIQMLTLKQKKEVSAQIRNHCEWLESIGAESLVEKWKDIRTYMFAEDKNYQIDQFKDIHNMRDKYRNEDFNKVYPMFAGLFD